MPTIRATLVVLLTTLTILQPLPPSDAGVALPPRGDPSRQRTLENGVQFVWEEDHRQPIVAIEARIQGGLRGEGRYVGTGMTHFIEHILFKGTPSRPAGTIEQEVRRYGGTINAFTSFDTTGISLFVESRHLREGLALLADILQHAVFEDTEVEKERAVILSEIQMNLDDPDRRIQHLFWGRRFLEHPYRHPILGYRSLLERLTAEDLRAFYRAQYQPQHVTLACAGDLDGERIAGLVEELFGSWPRGLTEPSQHLVPEEPPVLSPRMATAELPVQAAYLLLGFPSVGLTDPSLYALDVLASILGEGQSSRLYETIVRQRQLAHAITAWNYTPRDPGVFAIQLTTTPEQADAATQAALAVLDDVRGRGVTEAELNKAKRSVTADYLFGLQTVEARAGDLANSMAATGDPWFSRRYVEGIAQVNRQQVQEAARRFCDPLKLTTAVIRPPQAVSAAAAPSAAPRPTAFTKTVLPNGMTVLIGADRTLPIAAVVLAFRGGVRVETEEHQGLSHLTAQLLTKGTKRRTASEIAQTVESLGGTLAPFSGRDTFGLSLQLLSEDLAGGLELLHEVVTQSTFPEAEVAMQRELILKQLQSQDDDVFDVGGRLLRRTLFQTHPYRFNPLGERASVERLTREQCVAFARQWAVPSNTILTVLGDLDPVQTQQRLEQLFGGLPAGAAPWPDRLTEDRPQGIRESLKTMDREQAIILLGFQGSTHTADDRYALDVMTAVLSGMAGRLFQAVREAHGLSYTLGAVHVPGWDPGYLLVYAATKPDAQNQVMAQLDEQLERAAAEGFLEDEVADAKRYLIGLHRMDVQQVTGLAKRVALDELYGLGAEAWSRYETSLGAVTVEAVNAAAQRYLTLQHRARVVVSPNGKAP